MKTAIIDDPLGRPKDPSQRALLMASVSHPVMNLVLNINLLQKLKKSSKYKIAQEKAKIKVSRQIIMSIVNGKK